jgi:hypothetical protein
VKKISLLSLLLFVTSVSNTGIILERFLRKPHLLERSAKNLLMLLHLRLCAIVSHLVLRGGWNFQ